ncbi:hypothetical protein AgCh_007259 [Apium graveolens]
MRWQYTGSYVNIAPLLECRAENERAGKKSAKILPEKSEDEEEEEEEMLPEAPPVPFMVKRKRRFLVDEEDESD